MANESVTVFESDGVTTKVVKTLDVGRQAAAASKSVAASTEDKAVLDAIAASLALLDNSISAGNELQVDIVGALPAGTAAIGKVKVTNDAGTVIDPVAAGSAAMAASVPVTIATDDTIKVPLAGVAHDAADTGNPIKVGGIARAGLSGATLVAAADRINLSGSTDGSVYVRSVPLEDIVSGNASNTDGAITTVIATGGAGVKQYLTKVILTNMHASTTVYVELKSGTTVKATVPCPPGGCAISFDPPLPPNAADEVWAFDASAAVTTLYCSMVGFKSKV